MPTDPGILSLIICLCIGCVGEGGNDSAAALNGASREVWNTAPTWTLETAWLLTKELRLGAVDGGMTEIEQFASLASVTTDSRGFIYALDWQSQDIRAFSADGTPLHTIGRRGEGPGEFTGAWFLSVKSGDTLVVLDDMNMRFSLFGPDGDFVRDARRQAIGYGPPVQSLLSDGRYVDWAIMSPEGRLGPRTLYHPVVYDPSFARADTFPPIEFLSTMTEDGSMLLFDYGSAFVAAADRDGEVWFADSHEYRIYRRTIEGDTTLVFGLAVEAAAISQAARDSVRKRWEHRPDVQKAQLQSLPDTRPIVYGILPDNAGHIYVFPDVAGAVPGTIVDVFRDTGVYLGRMTLPDPLRLDPRERPVVYVDAEHMYVVVTDSLDMPYIHRLKIERDT